MLMVEAQTRKEMIEKNIPLVHSCAKKFKNRGVEYEDLFQSGCIGLIKAVDNFQADRGFQFSTYAVPVILGEIKRIFRDGGSIKISRALKENSRNLIKLKDELTVKNGNEPTIGELAQKAGITPEQTAQLLEISQPVLSLSFKNEDGECELDVPVESCELQIIDKIALGQALNELNENDRKIVELRFFKSLTQSKTAEILSMTQVQISRREKVIIKELRKYLS